MYSAGAKKTNWKKNGNGRGRQKPERISKVCILRPMKAAFLTMEKVCSRRHFFSTDYQVPWLWAKRFLPSPHRLAPSLTVRPHGVSELGSPGTSLSLEIPGPNSRCLNHTFGVQPRNLHFSWVIFMQTEISGSVPYNTMTKKKRIWLNMTRYMHEFRL